MRFNKQLFRHDPDNGVVGDCYRTIFSCFLDLDPEDVPHFYGDETLSVDQQTVAYRTWLEEQGYSLINILYTTDELDDVMASMEFNNPSIPYILVGESKNGTNHVVIACGGRIVHDPSIDNSGIVGPSSTGYYEVEFLTPKQTMPVMEGYDNA